MVDSELSVNDIRFLVSTLDSSLLERFDLILEDPGIVERMMEDGATKVFHRIMLLDENEVTTSFTPRFLFEILIRASVHDMKKTGYTVERSSTMKVPVFDSQVVIEFMQNKDLVKYLADMLASFTRIQSFTTRVRVRKGMWRKIRFNDMDLDSLMRYSRSVPEESRFKIYKRAADLCLFLLGMFPEHVTPVLAGSFSGQTTSWVSRRARRSAEDYMEEGKKLYKLAGGHEDAKAAGLTEVLMELGEHFDLARKPLNHISEHFIKFQKIKLFPSSS